jgi:PPM family protein phosphatase
MGLKVEAFGLSDIGPVRPNNEDAWIALKKHNFFALADGMGGHKAGEVAAKETIQTLSKAVQKISPSKKKNLTSKECITFLQTAIESANQKVFKLGAENRHFQGMGTTLCCLYLYQDSVIYAHVGDSRIYRFRDGELKLLTEDHSLISELMTSGQISDWEALPLKNVITRAIGTSYKVEPEIASVSAQPNDIFLMCTDGLSDFLKEEEIESVLMQPLPLKKMVSHLVQKAIEKGSHDNITSLMIKIKE